jgi:hypothetical protein
MSRGRTSATVRQDRSIVAVNECSQGSVVLHALCIALCSVYVVKSKFYDREHGPCMYQSNCNMAHDHEGACSSSTSRFVAPELL